MSDSATRGARVPAGVTPELQWQIEQFLYAEARLLDNREFEQWYDSLDGYSWYGKYYGRSDDFNTNLYARSK